MSACSASEQTISLAAAAECLGSTLLNVLLHVKRGQLRGHEGQDGWQIEVASLHALLLRRQQGEAEPLCRSGCSKAGGCGSHCA